jgi:hypothetical protein
MNESHYLASPQFVELKAMLDALPVSIGVLRLRCEIPNYPSFFPGGRGYKEPAFPEAPVMLVGHNFDTEEGFRDSVRRGAEDHLGMNTWVNLIRYFLPEAHVEEGECFFTNFYLGAIIHAEPEPGVKKKTTNRKVQVLCEVSLSVCRSTDQADQNNQAQSDSSFGSQGTLCIRGSG